MTTTQTPQVIAQPVPFLPPPRVPHNAFPTHESVAAVVGELAAPLLAVEQAVADAEAAVRELTECRPGVGGMPDGDRWRQAMVGDGEAYAAGTRPKKWKTQVLLEGDTARWALAQASTRGAQLVLARCRQQLEQDRIAVQASKVADANAQAWAEAARNAWESRADKLASLTAYRAGEEHLGEYRAAYRVALWAQGVAERPLDPENTAGVALLPADPTGVGFWLSAGLALEPGTTWLEIPDPAMVEWPEGGEELLLRAFPESAARLVSLRQHGYYATER